MLDKTVSNDREGSPVAADPRHINTSDQSFGGNDIASANNPAGEHVVAPTTAPIDAPELRKTGPTGSDAGYWNKRKKPAQNNKPASGLASPPRRRYSAGTPCYAALDLGTNNCRLLMAVPHGRSFRVVDSFSKIVRLGEELSHTGQLSEAAMDRTLDALQACKDKLGYHDVKRGRFITTEACRKAKNGTEFLRRVTSLTGLKLEVINGRTEAQLAVSGCASLVEREAENVILFDIGGGSTEIVWLDLRERFVGRRKPLANFIRSWASLPIGVVNLSEKHGGKTVTAENYLDMVARVDKLLESFPMADDLTEAVNQGNGHMLGTSGTVTTLAGVHLELERYDRRRVDGTWLSRPQITGLMQTIRDMDYQQRIDNPCIGQERADLVLAGCAILDAIQARWPLDRLRVADRGLREGILMGLMARDGVFRRKNFSRGGPPNRGRPTT